MNTRLLKYLFAFLVFGVSLTTYLLTVQKTVPFWDCAEFTAAAVYQQVPHPPGAPLFLMVGKLFHLLPFGDPAWRVNLVSVFATAFSVLLLYFISVMAIANIRGKHPEELAEALAVYGSSAVGALAFNFSDTLWFNGVESEVYAASTLFVALIVYLMMRWNEEADKEGHERYLLLIAYLIGLSTGVHLLSILAIFSITMVVYYRKYEVTTKSFIIMTIIALVAFAIVYPGIVKYFPALLGGDLPIRTRAKEYIVKDNPLMIVLALLILGGAGYGVWYGRKKSHPIIALVCSAFLLMVLGYSTYTQILIRSNANPPMNENAPTNLNTLVSYLGREQYGDAPIWPRRYQQDSYFVNEYRKYGEWYPPTIERAERSDGSAIPVPRFTKVNLAGELNYLFSYQIYHMYIRYFLWNFVGRMSDIQNAPPAWFSTEGADVINYGSGYASWYPIRFFALPLLVGILGVVFHFSRKRPMAFAFLVMFLMMGVLAAIQQNQQNPQPRERDYFYVGSFMVFCMWIGIGVYSVLDNLFKSQFRIVGSAAIVIVATILVPVNMAIGGWRTHDRSGNFMPFDYAYNILQSVEKDAILFTNGDNDTFSVWYMQDVMGVRRDVRIVNLSLGNTLWYVNQLKNHSPWGAKKIPLSFSDESIQQTDEYDPRALSTPIGGPSEVEIAVREEILRRYEQPSSLAANKLEKLPDSIANKTRTIKMTFLGMPYGEEDGKPRYVYRIQDQLVRDIVVQTAFERPVYYSASVGGDALCGLEKYFRMEGLAYRICPVPQSTLRGAQAVNSEIMDKTILNILPFDKFHTEQHYGFKLRNLNNPNAFFDETNRHPAVANFRNLYFNYANYTLYETNNPQKAAAILDTMNKYISVEQFPLYFPQYYQMALLYDRAGAKAQATRYARMAAQVSEKLMANPRMLEADPYSRAFDPHIVATESYELLGEFDKAIATLRKYQTVVSDAPEIQVRIDEVEIKRAEYAGDLRKALQIAESLVAKYDSSSNEFIKQMIPGLRQRVAALKLKLSTTPSTTTHAPQVP
ncbi:MAG: DUF2723 domain-containing protein [Bacteroidota bacterium]|nr:DUF2723 domain-containing protein [Candidatus Kapabacteria bacterium]MDW8219948.1 DUF2723 domain-containing protein [Bacteroidota bacterium]